MKSSIYTLLITFGCISTQLVGQTLYPKKGEIVFVKEAKIYDTIAYEKSKEKFAVKFVDALEKQVKRDSEELGESIDSVELENKLNFFRVNIGNLFFSQMFNALKEYYHLKMMDSLALSYKVIDNKILGDYYVKNVKDNTFFWLAKMDSTTIYSRGKIHPTETSIIDFKENRSDIKYIHGYECFKITFMQEEILDENFKMVTIYTMYVTDKIKSSQHPTIKERIILENYFPLEISESFEEIEGVKTIYTLEKLTLN